MLGPSGGAGGPLGPKRVSRNASAGRDRLWRTAYEHRASELRIVVNGFVVGTHTVGRTLTRQSVAVTLDEPIGSSKCSAKAACGWPFSMCSRCRRDRSISRSAFSSVSIGVWKSASASRGHFPKSTSSTRTRIGAPRTLAIVAARWKPRAASIVEAMSQMMSRLPNRAARRGPRGPVCSDDRAGVSHWLACVWRCMCCSRRRVPLRGPRNGSAARWSP